MSRKYKIIGDSKQRQDYDTYLLDKHIRNDTLLALSSREMYELLLALNIYAPHTMSRQLCILYPLGPDRYDDVEHKIQQMLPSLREEGTAG